MNIFEYRNSLIHDYSTYIKSFIKINDLRIREKVDYELNSGTLYPDPLIQMNPNFKLGKSISELVSEGILNSECEKVFRRDKSKESKGIPLSLYKHQEEAIRLASKGENFILTTGTGSGKSLSYITPIVNYVLNNPKKNSIKAIVVYPMNALANSQMIELDKYINEGYPDRKGPVTFKRYTGQEREAERDEIIKNPPDILLTNYVMLELILTRVEERPLINAAEGIKFIVFDEIHTYRGRQGADVAMLIRRLKDKLNSKDAQCIGTSATMASTGSYEQQLQQVADFGTLFFGAGFSSKNIIGETLVKVTKDIQYPNQALVERVNALNCPNTYEDFVKDPLAIFIDNTLGVEENKGKLVRCLPKTLSQTAKKLSDIIKTDLDACKAGIIETLLHGYNIKDSSTGRVVFAFRLHQFISKGNTVYSSSETPDKRYITLNNQNFVPDGQNNKPLLPLCFCRECGQEYYLVKRGKDKTSNRTVYLPRGLNERRFDEESDDEAGFLIIKNDLGLNPQDWIPQDWKDENGKVLPARRNNVPKQVNVSPQAEEVASGGVTAFYMSAPFRFCPNCGVSYYFRLSSDFTKLSTLSTEGRSTATTILSLSALANLKKQDLDKKAKKILSFTDNRQDASLQSGHFNDFIEVGLLRGALYKAVSNNPNGIGHDHLTQKVFDSLNLELNEYAQDPSVRYGAKEDTDKALRDVLGYELYRDLKRGWRVTAPNLEQCGLLEIDYKYLNEFCKTEEEWKGCHQVLASSTPEKRMYVAKVILDYLRRDLAIDVDYLKKQYQERLRQNSNRYLTGSWAVDEDESKLEYASIAFPRARGNERGEHLYISPKSSLALWISKKAFKDIGVNNLPSDERQDVIFQILDNLRKAGILIKADEDENGLPGYQINAGSMIWKVGDGRRSYQDPIRMPNVSRENENTNEFFKDFYINVASSITGFEAKEHTAQVPSEEREKREELFRTGKLPILFCSPTMELGIDIDQLNVVNMRNVPPTPANYAQRSGRAGRSGQPALVFTYCVSGNSHDQYFFRRQLDMVSGVVATPRIDITNRQLIESHIHAIWLTESGLSLGKSLVDLIDISTPEIKLELKENVKNDLKNKNTIVRAKTRAENVIKTIEHNLKESKWYDEKWLEHTLNKISLDFNETCDRWRNLYTSALEQQKKQNERRTDFSVSEQERQIADRLRKEAESQLDLLVSNRNTVQSDFYSYRYFASEGFLPGYSFPRLPLSAFIPARRIKSDNEFLSRPRFLAISEFGPRSVIYHEGSKYLINRVIFPGNREEAFGTKAKVCEECGYLHKIEADYNPDRCELCNTELSGKTINNLFRLQNVSTIRRERINSDEEERLRYGYDIKTVVRFSESNFHLQNAEVVSDNNLSLATIKYGDNATLWRINFGWKKRRDKSEWGFLLDMEKGYWARNREVEGDDEDNIDVNIVRPERVIPYVEDYKNCLILDTKDSLPENAIPTLESALKNSIQAIYQLEDNELSTQFLPDTDNCKLILFYESSEGGAGVLKQIVNDNEAVKVIARKALELCHFDPATGKDLGKHPDARENCSVACYDCLMNYSNQSYHKILNRHDIKDFLLSLSNSKLKISTSSASPDDQLDYLKRLCTTSLEHQWLDYVHQQGYKLPSSGQKLIESCKTRPDFIYEKDKVAIYIDGPHHEYPERKQRDVKQDESMMNKGFTVVRFDYKEKWEDIFKKYPSIFGRKG